MFFEERIFVRRSHQLACIASNRADFVVERFAYARLDSGVVIRKGVQVSRVTESGRLKFQSKLGGGDEQIVLPRMTKLDSASGSLRLLHTVHSRGSGRSGW